MRCTLVTTLWLVLAAALALVLAVAGLEIWTGAATGRTHHEAALRQEQVRTVHDLRDALAACNDAIEGMDGPLNALLARAEALEQQIEATGLSDRQRELLQRLRELRTTYANAPDMQADQSADEWLRMHAPDAQEQAQALSALFAREAQFLTTKRMAALHAQTQQASRLTLGLAALLFALLAGLGWWQTRAVLLPLRDLARQARRQVGGGAKGETDDRRALARYLEQLTSDVDEARLDLARSRRHLLDAEKLAGVGKIAAGVAHEIRSPLTSLKLRLFSMQKALGAARQADLAVMSEEISRLDNIIRNFLEFSRPPELSVGRCNVQLLLDKTEELLRYKLSASRIQWVRTEAENLPPVLADAHQLRQVLLNLINNAIDALPRGGRIELRVLEERTDDDKRMVLVRVRDNGPGIPEPSRERIFDPFFSTKDDGAGLGLWIAQRIMAQHGGGLSLAHTSQAGTEFVLYIPAVEEGEHG